MAETDEPPPLVSSFVGFAGALRDAGVPIGSGDVLTFCEAAATLDPTDLVDLYWAGRTTLIGRRDHLPIYDRTFRWWFLGEGTEGSADPQLRRRKATGFLATTLEIPLTEPEGERRDEDEARLGLVGADAEVLRHKSFSACTPDELAAIRRIMARIRVTPPRRRTRRTRRSDDGTRPDLRRTVREALRSQGEPTQLRWRKRTLRLRPLILLLDVSGSMADHSRALLQFAHSARRADGRVEVFCFGTRLTRITRALERRRPDEAMARAAATVVDWEGGTRIGDSVEAFVRGWGRRGMGRGAVVVICSDGLDRGDPDTLAHAMERLARLSHRIVWLNPNLATEASAPNTLGMMVAAPHVDALLPGADLTGLERFAARLHEFA